MAGDRKSAGLLTVMRAVMWSFLGIRRRQEHEADAVRLTMKQVVIAGIIAALLFITTIVLVVRLVLHMAAS